MECVKEKKFLFWKWKQVDHRYKMHTISKFMSCSDTFHVTYKCSACGAGYKRKFVEQDELILAGIKVENLQEVSDYFLRSC